MLHGCQLVGPIMWVALGFRRGEYDEVPLSERFPNCPEQKLFARRSIAMAGAGNRVKLSCQIASARRATSWPWRQPMSNKTEPCNSAEAHSRPIFPAAPVDWSLKPTASGSRWHCRHRLHDVLGNRHGMTPRALSLSRRFPQRGKTSNWADPGGVE